MGLLAYRTYSVERKCLICSHWIKS
ncbi:hypothetical protein A5810_003082, partial [Enterococcus faecium]